MIFVVNVDCSFPKHHDEMEIVWLNQVAWALMARSSFQGRIRRISGSILRGNNAWSVHMSLCMSRISRPPLVGRKPVRKSKKGNCLINRNYIFVGDWWDCDR